MSHESQVVIPPSFYELYTSPGRTKPAAPAGEIATRYEVCEDLATALTEHAKTVQWQHGAAEQDVLERIHLGLLSAESGLNESESLWVVRRLAELLEWRDLQPPYVLPT